MHEAVQAIAATGVSPIVRVAADEGWMVKRALDCGAHGIIVPLLRTQADAQKIVRAAKFPPLGIRGFGSPFSMGAFTAAGGNMPTSIEYLKQANDSLLTIIQIETREALENVNAIAGTEGVDVSARPMKEPVPYLLTRNRYYLSAPSTWAIGNRVDVGP